MSKKDIFNNDFVFCDVTSEREIFSHPVDIVMAQGGDKRLLLSTQTGLNQYYTRPYPCDDMIVRSSCTTSFPTKKAFEETQALYQEFKDVQSDQKKKLFSEKMDHVRNRLKKGFKLPEDAALIAIPSGTTAEIVFSFLAQAYAQKMSCKGISNIVVAAEEVGSKSAVAAACRHFSIVTPRGNIVEDDGAIDGSNAERINLVEIFARHKESGILKDEAALQNELDTCLEDVITKKGHCAVLHFVQASKTGITVPRIEFIEEKKKQYGDSLIVVVDAAQTRCTRDSFLQYYNAGFCTFVTGSKLFGGVSFSGAIILPEDEAAILEKTDVKVPVGFSDYVSQHDVDQRLVALRQGLDSWENYGLLFRWETALQEMERLYAVDASLRDNVIVQWVNQVKKYVQASEHVRLLDDLGDGFQHRADVSLLGEENTIIPVVCSLGKGHATIPDLRIIYRLLIEDISLRLPVDASEQEKCLAQEKILIGQLVKLSQGDPELGIVRIALSAPLISDIAGDAQAYNDSVEQRMQNELMDDKKIIDKLDLICKYFNHLKN